MKQRYKKKEEKCKKGKKILSFLNFLKIKIKINDDRCTSSLWIVYKVKVLFLDLSHSIKLVLI